MSERKSEFLFDWFEQTCLLCSNSVAIIDESTGLEVSYGDLLDKVTYVSEILQVMLDPEASETFDGVPLVSVLTSRSLATIIALLSLFHSGAAFNLIDGSIFERNSKDVNEKLHAFTHPNPQLMIVDEANLLPLQQLSFATALPPLIVVDRVGNIVDVTQAKKRPDPIVPLRTPAERSLAYLHYLSGCLGKPKGVLVTHRGLMNALRECKEVFGLNEKDRALFHSDLTSETALLEIFLPLICGASVVIASSKTKKNSDRLIEVVHSYDITFIQGLVTLFDRLTVKGWTGKANLTIVIDSDAISTSFYDVIAACSRVFHVYSCPETTLCCATYLFPKHNPTDPVASTTLGIPVGKPIAHTSFYLLDERLQEVSNGESGELYIAGYGMCLGYHQNKLQTALKFVPNPTTVGEQGLGKGVGIGQVPLDRRCFKTGDVMRRGPDGQYILERRLDDVAKYKGYRFELKEVRLYLESFPKIAQAVAVVLEGSLVALITLKASTASEATSDETSLIAEIREHLHHLLPHYMIPRDFMFLEHIPTLPNGRIDRQQLLLPSHPSVRRTMSLGSDLGLPDAHGVANNGLRDAQGTTNKKKSSVSDSIFCCFSSAAIDEGAQRRPDVKYESVPRRN